MSGVSGQARSLAAAPAGLTAAQHAALDLVELTEAIEWAGPRRSKLDDMPDCGECGWPVADDGSCGCW